MDNLQDNDNVHDETIHSEDEVDLEDTETAPVKKNGIEKVKQRSYTMTPARKKAIEAMKEARAASIQKKKDEKEKLMNEIEHKEELTEHVKKKAINKKVNLTKDEERAIKARAAKKIRDLKREIKRRKEKELEEQYQAEDDTDDEDDSSEEEVVVPKKKNKSKVKKKTLEIEEIDEPVDNRNHFQKSGLTPEEYQRFMGF